MLLDIHPEPEDSRVEVQVGNNLFRVGRLGESDHIRRTQASRAVLASVVGAGYFGRKREITFDFLYHFDSVEAWLSYMAERWADAQIDPAIVGRARELLSAGTGKLLIRRRLHAARLIRGTTRMATSGEPILTGGSSGAHLAFRSARRPA